MLIINYYLCRFIVLLQYFPDDDVVTLMMPHRGREIPQPPHAFYRRRVMGSTGSLLNEAMYERDTTMDHEPSIRKFKYRIDEPMLPSKIMPYSGRLDKVGTRRARGRVWGTQPCKLVPRLCHSCVNVVIVGVFVIIPVLLL